MHRNFLRTPVITLVTCLASAPALALDYQVEAFASTENEDNSVLSNDSASETTYAYGTQLSLSNEWSKFSMDGSYKATREEFQNNNISDQTVYEGDSAISLNLVDKYASVFVSHSAERQLESVTDVNTPDNEEAINIYRLGTNLGLPVSSKIDLGLNLQTQKIDVAASENTIFTNSRDSEADSARASIFYQLNPATLLEVSSQLVQSEREDSDIKQDTLFSYVGFNRNVRQMNYAFQIGESRFDIGDISESGLFYDLSVGFVGEGQSATLGLSQQDTNTAIGEIDTQISGTSLIDDLIDIDQDSIVNSAENSAVEISSAFLSYSNSVCIRCELTVGLSFESTDFKFSVDNANTVSDSTEADREEFSARTGFGYRISNRLTSNIAWSREYITLIGRQGDFEENNYYFSLSWQPNNRLGITSTVFLLNRAPEQADDPNLKNSGVNLTISYLLLNSQ